MKGTFTEISNTYEARKIIIRDYGAFCEVPFAYFLPDHEGDLETITLTESQQKRYYGKIKAEVIELRAVKSMLESIEKHTWIYLLGFRAGIDGKIVNPSIEWQIEKTPHPSAWVVLAKRLGIDTDNFDNLKALVSEVIASPFVSDFEQGINYIFKPEDVTGSGSDALDPDGRIRLREYFGLAKYCENLNEKLVRIFDDIRKLNPRR